MVSPGTSSTTGICSFSRNSFNCAVLNPGIQLVKAANQLTAGLLLPASLYSWPQRVRISRDIRDLRGRSSWSMQGLIRNRLLRLARRSYFGPGRRSSVFRRSWNTNPREERVRISRDILDARGRSSWSMQEGLTRNRLLRLARRSNFGPGHRSRVSARSRNTNPRGEKFCRCRNISAARQNNI